MEAQKQTAPETVIRSLGASDAGQLRALYRYSLQKNPQGFVQDPMFHGDIFLRSQRYQDEQGTMLGLFLEDDSLCGFGGLKRKDDSKAEFCNLHLHPASQGQGWGQYLAEALITEAHRLGYKTLELHVTLTQEKAINLYKRLGFIETKRTIYDVEGKKFDTLFMELRL